MNADIPRIFVGIDEVEIVGYHVFASSVMRRASRPVSITPMWSRQLGGMLWRYRDWKSQSNEFTFSRFLVPYLCGYNGWAIFADGSDMLCRDDIVKLWNLRDDHFAVMVAKHDYVPVEKVKYLGNRQDSFPRKNWVSVMLMNCGRCQQLTLDYINAAPKHELHQFDWLHDITIGSIPLEWNHLVGIYDENPGAKLAHFTLGIPPYNSDCEFASEWECEKQSLLHMREQ